MVKPNLYKVSLDIQVEFVVLSHSEDGANQIACDMCSSEIKEYAEWVDDDFDVNLIKSKKEIPEGWHCSVPYSNDIDESIGDPTVEEILDEQIKADEKDIYKHDLTRDMFGDLEQ